MKANTLLRNRLNPQYKGNSQQRQLNKFYQGVETIEVFKDGSKIMRNGKIYFKLLP